MNKLKAVILAAGKGTRMNSDLPKVIHKCLGRPMVHYVIQACKDAGAGEVCVIVGYKGREVKDAIYDVVDYVEQKEQLGTGHAVKCAKDFIGTEGDTLVLCGDTPLITGKTLTELVEKHRKEANSGMYIFNSEALSASLDLLSNDNAAGEYYLTDTIALIKKIGLKVSALPLTGDACDEIRGVNTIDQLEEAEQIMCHRED